MQYSVVLHISLKCAMSYYIDISCVLLSVLYVLLAVSRVFSTKKKTKRKLRAVSIQNITMGHFGSRDSVKVKWNGKGNDDEWVSGNHTKGMFARHLKV